MEGINKYRLTFFKLLIKIVGQCWSFTVANGNWMFELNERPLASCLCFVCSVSKIECSYALQRLSLYFLWRGLSKYTECHPMICFFPNSQHCSSNLVCLSFIFQRHRQRERGPNRRFIIRNQRRGGRKRRKNEQKHTHTHTLTLTHREFIIVKKISFEPKIVLTSNWSLMIISVSNAVIR